MTDRTASEVLRKTRETLETAKLGFADLTGDDPKRRMAGLRNVVVFGRSVSLVLQTMRSVDREGFDAWYAPIQEAMRADPLLRYIGDLRNEILKEGAPDYQNSVYVRSLQAPEWAELNAKKPPGAVYMVIGDRLGGTGWMVNTPDGAEMFYVTPPESMGVETNFHLADPPTEHLGQPIQDTSLAGLTRLYVAYLDKFVVDAEAHFS